MLLCKMGQIVDSVAQESHKEEVRQMVERA